MKEVQWMDYLVGIDLGSTTLKAVIYDTRGNVVASGCRPTDASTPTRRTRNGRSGSRSKSGAAARPR